MRYVGILLMAGSVAGGGFYLAGQWEERIRILRIFLQTAEFLQRQILYSGTALPEALKEAGSRAAAERSGLSAEPGRFFIRVSEAMERESSALLSSVWSRELRAFPGDFPLRKQDRQALLALGRQLGCGDRQLQERVLALYLSETERSFRELREQAAERERLFCCLGLAAGCFLAVLFV